MASNGSSASSKKAENTGANGSPKPDTAANGSPKPDSANGSPKPAEPESPDSILAHLMKSGKHKHSFICLCEKKHPVYYPPKFITMIVNCVPDEVIEYNASATLKGFVVIEPVSSQFLKHINLNASTVHAKIRELEFVTFGQENTYVPEYNSSMIAVRKCGIRHGRDYKIASERPLKKTSSKKLVEELDTFFDDSDKNLGLTCVYQRISRWYLETRVPPFPIKVKRIKGDLVKVISASTPQDDRIFLTVNPDKQDEILMAGADPDMSMLLATEKIYRPQSWIVASMKYRLRFRHIEEDMGTVTINLATKYIEVFVRDEKELKYRIDMRLMKVAKDTLKDGEWAYDTLAMIEPQFEEEGLAQYYIDLKPPVPVLPPIHRILLAFAFCIATKNEHP